MSLLEKIKLSEEMELQLEAIENSNLRCAQNCFHAKVEEGYITGVKELRVRCDVGHRLGKANDGTVSWISVLRCRKPKICDICTDFDGFE